MNHERRSLMGLESCFSGTVWIVIRFLLVAIMAVSLNISVAKAAFYYTADWTIPNETGFTANDLHLVLHFEGGPYYYEAITPKFPVDTNSRSGTELVQDWSGYNVKPGETVRVQITIGADKPNVSLVSLLWTSNGDPIPGPNQPDPSKYPLTPVLVPEPSTWLAGVGVCLGMLSTLARRKGFPVSATARWPRHVVRSPRNCGQLCSH